jgi:hypothetical protein
MTIKLLASDLDGTLIADLHTIPARTQAAIRAAMARGVHVTIATGREYPVTKKFVDILGLTTPIICYQGAMIFDPVNQTSIASEGLPLPLAHRLIDLARSHGASLYMYLNNRAYTEQPTPQSRAMLHSIGTPLDEVADLKQVITAAPVKGMIVHPAHETEALMTELRAGLNGNLNVFRSLDTIIEVTSPGVSKGKALARLAAYYGLDRSEVMAMGDQENDIDMLAWAGVGIAMDNATPAAKAAATHIAPPVTEEGAAWAIERFILGEP